jgi:hypothetical protein
MNLNAQMVNASKRCGYAMEKMIVEIDLMKPKKSVVIDDKTGSKRDNELLKQIDV